MKESHYNKGGIEVIDFIRDQLTPEEFNGFCKGNILKYVPRSNHKGDPIADAQKVRDYADYWISANLRVNKVAELGQVSTEKAQELADTIVELRRDNAELKTVIERLKVEIDMHLRDSKDVDSLLKTIKDYRAEIARLKDDKAQLEKLNKVRGEQREKYQHKNVELKEEIERLKQVDNERLIGQRDLLEEREQKIRDLNTKAKKAEKDRFNSVKMAEALRESVDRLQKENRSLKDVIEKKEKDSVADGLKPINYDKFKNA